MPCPCYNGCRCSEPHKECDKLEGSAAVLSHFRSWYDALSRCLYHRVIPVAVHHNSIFMPTTYFLAGVIEEDHDGLNSVGEAALVSCSSEGADPVLSGSGSGPHFIAEVAQQILGDAGARLVTFGGLDILRAAWEQLGPEPSAQGHAVRRVAASPQHADIAFDFTCDNGYDVPWDSIASHVPRPASVPSPKPEPNEAVGAAFTLAALFLRGAATGAVVRTSMAGSKTAWPLAGARSTQPAFRSVPSAARLAAAYPPDQSWKTHSIIDPVQSAEWALSTAV